MDTTGISLMVIVIASDDAIHEPDGSSVVKVKVTVPAVISPAEGVYTAFNVLAFGVNVPAPPVHEADEALPPNAPFKVWVALAQMVTSGPALAVAGEPHPDRKKVALMV